MLGILELVGLLLAVVPNTVLTGLFAGHGPGRRCGTARPKVG
jgi:hypothetical protein